MKSPPRATSQLIPNRGLLNRINPVVKRHNKNKNTEVPPEWITQNAEAYRLLVGPNIKKFIDIDLNDNESVDNLKTLELDKEKKKREKLLSSLTPSRLKTPYKPFDITVKQLDALNLPNDLLVQVGPPGSYADYDILASSLKNRLKTNRRIVRPISQNYNYSIESTPRSKMLTSKTHFSSLSDEFLFPESLMENKNNQNEIFKKLKKRTEEKQQTEPIQLEIQMETKIVKKYKKPKRTIEEFFKSKEQKMIVKIRQMFYILRCYSSYNINKRSKAVFVTKVNEARILLHYLKKWHSYTYKKNLCKKFNKQVNDLTVSRKTTKIFRYWKSQAEHSVRLARISGDKYRSIQTKILRNCFREFHSMTKSKRLCRFDIVKCFRYNIDGPFRPINSYYTKVRDKTIKAYNFNFRKTCPIFIKHWRLKVKEIHQDRENSSKLYGVIRKYTFYSWYECYKHHFHQRIMVEVRRKAKKFLIRAKFTEKEKAENIEKSMMIQLIHDRNIFSTKLRQFDRLGMNHQEAINKRIIARTDITDATTNYFRKQEENNLVECFKNAQEVSSKVREIRCQLAEGFLYHFGRAVRSFDNQVVAQQFCTAFRVLSTPIIEKAVKYFYEKKVLKKLISINVKQRKVLCQLTSYSKIFHQLYGFSHWRKFIDLRNAHRTPNLMNTIRRRTEILQLYPYFNWVECLPVRPPRPLKEVEHIFKDLPLVSIQRKVARERMHHVNVRMVLQRRRVLRDFLRAFASFVQEQISTRNVIILMRKKRSLSLMRKALHKFYVNAKKIERFETKPAPPEEIVQNDINAWFLHFFTERGRQHRIVTDAPYC